MYDPKEADASREYLLRLLDKTSSLGDCIVVVGGWGVYYLVRKEFKRATGSDYLRSRDIDIAISSKEEDVSRIKDAIADIGFTKSGLPFRYQLYLDWDSGEPIGDEVAKKMPVYQMVHIYLDIFSGSKVDIGTWVMPEVKGILQNKVMIDGIPVVGPKILLGMKMRAFLGRDNLEKRQKDACDIFGLLFYSGLSLTKDERKGYDNELNDLSNDHSGVIAEHLFRDRGLSGIIRRRIEQL